VATGIVSRDTAAAREVVVSSRNGFPWQASIGAAVEEFEFGAFAGEAEVGEFFSFFGPEEHEVEVFVAQHDFRGDFGAVAE
jgi:hypothetical protein